MGIQEQPRRWVAGDDACATGRLAGEESEEATRLGRTMKENARNLTLNYLAGCLLLSMLLMGIKRGMSFGEALVMANVILVALAAGLAGVWFGQRRQEDKPLWRMSAPLMLVSAIGACAGAIVPRLLRGDLTLVSSAEDLVRYVSIGLLTGLVLSGFVVGADWIRGREARAREARLRAEAEGARLAKRMAEAELKLLQAQVEPHFLFNTLANLRWLVQTDSKDALPMLDHLIEYLRTALPEMRAESSTVGREVALVRAYLEILRIRMGGELAFGVDVEPDLEPHVLPPLMLITLVENAVKHGVAPVGRGRIDVRVTKTRGTLRLEVDDDGRGVAAEPGIGVGLANMRERLAVLYGNRATLQLASRDGGGARAAIEIAQEGP